MSQNTSSLSDLNVKSLISLQIVFLMRKIKLNVINMLSVKRTSSPTAHHPSDFPDCPERGQAGEVLQTGLNAAQAALEERGQAACDFLGSAVGRFFSAGVAACSVAHIPVETAQ
jgi:hypothetical protein